MPPRYRHRAVARDGNVVDAEDGGVDLADDPGERDDVEDALAAAQQVDDLLARAHEHGALADDDEVRRGEILADRLPQALDRAPGLAQVDAAVEELLDHLQLEQVPVGVKPLGTAASRLRQRRTAQARAVPVVELAVA